MGRIPEATLRRAEPVETRGKRRYRTATRHRSWTRQTRRNSIQRSRKERVRVKAQAIRPIASPRMSPGRLNRESQPKESCSPDWAVSCDTLLNAKAEYPFSRVAQ